MAEFLRWNNGRLSFGFGVRLQVDDKEWIDQVVKGEDIVQREDMHMCDLVQKGLASPAYDVGRWASPCYLVKLNACAEVEPY